MDDAASTASQESHVSPPVVILPLDQQLVDANLGLEELQTFQHVDNVVELQLQPVPPPPPPSTTVSVDASFFDKVNNMMETFNQFVPFLSELGSARRSPTAGSSDIVSPNPIDRVSDAAPQGPVAAPQSPDVAPGPSSASLEPRASGSGLRLHRDVKFAPPHVVIWTRETSTVGFAMLRSRLPLRTKIDSGSSWRMSTASYRTPEKSLISIAPMVGCLQISPRMIWRISNPNMLSLA